MTIYRLIMAVSAGLRPSGAPRQSFWVACNIIKTEMRRKHLIRTRKENTNTILTNKPL